MRFTHKGKTYRLREGIVIRLQGSALVLLGTLIICLKKGKETARGATSSIIVLLLLAGIATAMEFALEQKIGFLDWMRADLCYLVMTGCSVCMFITVYKKWKKAFQRTDICT